MEMVKQFNNVQVTFGEDEFEKDFDLDGSKVKLVLLSDGRLAVIREGKGKDAEDAMMIAGKDRKKYMTAMMAKTISIEDAAIPAEQLSQLSLKDYMRLQAAFADINF